MSDRYTFNPFTNKLDDAGSKTSSVVTIPEYTVDPSVPAQATWILRSGSGGAIPDGTPIGLLMALTYTSNGGTPYSYQFSYYTKEGTIKRVTIS